MQLIVAEKPSVARDLARVLGVRPAGKSYFEGAHHVITWCIGHLVELEEPAAYDGRWKAWRLDSLPMLPTPFRLRPSKHAAEQLRVVARLLGERRFTSVVNACDAGREGELIFRYVYQYAGGGPPVQRLWISSLTDDAIRRGFSALRPGRQLDPLGDAARSRSEADWLVGMNATRGITVRSRESGHDALYSIGRVQTPTLAMLVEREHAIRQFVPRDYWEVRGDFTTATGERFAATWRRIAPPGAAGAPGIPGATSISGATGIPGTAGAIGTTSVTGVTGAAGVTAGIREGRPSSSDGDTTRVGSLAVARAIVARDAAHGTAADPLGPRVERLRARTVREPPPLLFDLTSLQRTANRRFGWSASRTLELAQALYERHKLITYPRTDARHLTTDLARDLPRVFAVLAGVPDYAAFAGQLAAQPPRPTRRVVDDAKVHDHHAIIPTGTAGTPDRFAALDRDEHRLFDLIARRFLGAFFPDAEFAVTEAWIRVLAPDGRLPPFPGESRPQVERPRATDAPRSQRDSATEAEPPIVDVLPPPPDRYLARGRVRMVAGWQEVAGMEATSAARRVGVAPDRGGAARGGGFDPDAELSDGDQGILPVLVEGQPLDGTFSTIAKQTRPPPRYTEATLLSAMESAGKIIDDEALREAMKDRGLGTPATRAAIIETLLRRAYIVRDKQHLVPTAIGIGLIAALPAPSLASAELTGAWEARLARIARGQETRADFMADIERYVADLVESIRSSNPPPPPPDGAPAQARPRGRRWPSPQRRSAPTASLARRRSSAAEASRVNGRDSNRHDSNGHDSNGHDSKGHGANGSSPARAAPKVSRPPRTEALTCPRCGAGTLITGARGWGCSRWRDGCRFVIWFETSGRRLTLAQLRDLVVRGRTRKARFGERTGSLILDGDRLRFEPADEATTTATAGASSARRRADPRTQSRRRASRSSGARQR
ncbi:MAG TPA: DNA topoisomerase [Kofleriaceae bacterium]|nr:DNA topoisomerase [Kofleriaceae bacterium]